MIGRETRMLLRHYLAQGASKSALARQLGSAETRFTGEPGRGDLDRDLDTTAVRYGPRRPLPTRLDAYKAIGGLPRARLCASGTKFGPPATTAGIRS
jgi:hypothetical protein